MAKGDDKSGSRWGWHRKPHCGPPWLRGGAPFGPMAMAEKPARMFAQGDLRLLLLALIADQPSHGYDLIRTIEAKFGGAYAPSPGTIYPNLTFLEEQELVTGTAEAGGKKSYTATDKGRRFLDANAEQVKALMARIDIMANAKGGSPVPESILLAVVNLRHAILARAGEGWPKAEEERVLKVLQDAAKRIVGGP